MNELNKVLESDEKIIWEGAPSFKPYFFSRSFLPAIGGLIWILFLGGIMVASVSETDFFRYVIYGLPHFLFGLCLIFIPSIYSLLVYRHTHYAITEKRLVIQKGWIGRDFETLDLDLVTNAEVKVGVFDQIFGGKTGSIIVASAGSLTYSRNAAISKPYVLSNIENPYEVFKLFKKISHETRTDVEFPNKLRP